jgi:hypothetical protein
MTAASWLVKSVITCFYALVQKLALNQRISFSLVDMYGMSITEAGCKKNCDSNFRHSTITKKLSLPAGCTEQAEVCGST